MISINGVDYIKKMAELQADEIPGGVLYLITDGNTFTWRKASSSFDLDIFQIGQKLNANSIAVRSLKQKKKIIENVPRSLYGMRLKTIAEPLINDNGDVVGVFSIVFPRFHSVAKAFKDFAPILAEMFSEGSCFILTDLLKIVDIQSSKKFQVPSLEIGEDLKENFITKKVINTKQLIVEELDSSFYGVPVLVTGYPLFDEDNNNNIVATLCIITPKKTASDLRNLSSNLATGLEAISSTIEELAASASQIHENEQELNNGIREIINLSEEINQTSIFIKQIADKTTMLGLNASIEAARAGEAGRGFGVVADEIRKLSEQSKSTVPKIKKLTDNIKISVDESSEKSKHSLSSSQDQAAATEEITASLEEITSMSEELNKIAQNL